MYNISKYCKIKTKIKIIEKIIFSKLSEYWISKNATNTNEIQTGNKLVNRKMQVIVVEKKKYKKATINHLPNKRFCWLSIWLVFRMMSYGYKCRVVL